MLPPQVLCKDVCYQPAAKKKHAISVLYRLHILLDSAKHTSKLMKYKTVVFYSKMFSSLHKRTERLLNLQYIVYKLASGFLAKF